MPEKRKRGREVKPQEKKVKKPAKVEKKEAKVVVKGKKEKPKKKEVKKEEKAEKKPEKAEKKEAEKKKPVDKGEQSKAYAILLFPLITEKAVNMIEAENKLVFIVNENSTKQEVRKAVESLYGVEVDRVNIIRDMKSRKRAIVKINKKYKADDIATKLGVL